MKLSLSTLCVLLSFLVCFCLSSCDKSQKPIRIGLAINLSGRGGEAGEHIRDGALLAIEHVNNSGGINGSPLELLIRDDKNSDEGVRKADESLIADGVVAIIGHSQSSNTIKSYPFVTSHNTLLITAYTAATKLSGQDDFFIRTSVDCELYGAKTAALLKRKNAHSVAFLMDMTNSAFVLDYADHVKKHFSGVVREVKFDSRAQADWTQIIKDLLVSQPDAIVLLTEASMTGVALQKLIAAGYSGDCVGTVWAHTPGLMRHAGNSAENFSIITFVNPENSTPGYISFSKEIEGKFHKKASAGSTRAYEVVMILASALKRSESISSDDLKKSLLTGKYDTLMGHVEFDQFGDVIRPVYEVVVHGKKFYNNGEI
jgi:branched-chain amino acid transport system substrate-binding protein